MSYGRRTFAMCTETPKETVFSADKQENHSNSRQTKLSNWNNENKTDEDENKIDRDSRSENSTTQNEVSTAADRMNKNTWVM